MVTKTEAEIDEMRELIRRGELPADAIETYLENEEKAVFGHDVKHDRHGNPIEQGVGSASQPSRNSINAYKAHQFGNKFGPEPDYEENLKRMEAELKVHEDKRGARLAAAKAKRKKAA